jgi:hypothetical protein
LIQKVNFLKYKLIRLCIASLIVVIIFSFSSDNIIDDTTKSTIDQIILKKVNQPTKHNEEFDISENDAVFLFLKNSRKKSSLEIIQKDSVKNISRLKRTLLIVEFKTDSEEIVLKEGSSSVYVNFPTGYSLVNAP